ncbi:MAG: glycosyltransferase family 4 protein [Bacteroidota bacterium]
MRVLFVLPAPVRIPMGGAAVVYRHAEGLVTRGHEVTVAAPRRQEGVRGRVLKTAVALRDRVHGVAERVEYAASGVASVVPETWRDLDGHTYDAVIATGHQTAEWVISLAEQGKGFYLLQHDERHLTEAAASTWQLPLVRIAVARWIADTVEAEGAPVAGVVPNAVDLEHFQPRVPPEERRARVVALYHRLPSKGPDILIETLRRLRERLPAIEADVISARPPRHRLPSWVDVHIRPEADRLADLYNRAAVCLHTSRLEGWGLVPMEAAACGCAVVATESRGVNEYLHPGRSMLQVPVDDVEGLAASVVELIEDSSRRRVIAQAGRDDVARFSWDASTDALEQILLDHAPS